MPDRDLSHLTPALYALCVKHLAACHAEGLDVFVTFTRRTLAEQRALYAQGRECLAQVNALRAQAGLPLITAAENVHVVTWTLKSKHLPGPDGLARAYDIAIRDADGRFWDTKLDRDHDRCPDFLEVAKIGKALGLECGYFWKHPDPAHFQLDRLPEE